MHIMIVVYSLQDAPTNTACYLPPDYNCTPLAKVHVKLSKSLNDGKTRSINQHQCQVIKDPEKPQDPAETVYIYMYIHEI